MIPHGDLVKLLPHEGAMSLLDSVQTWSMDRISCLAVSHRDATNPLAIDGVLSAIAGVEYAAQAMAIHGALVARSALGQFDAPRAGYLATVRDVIVSVPRLDALASPLEILADRLVAEDARVIYNFSITSGGLPVLSGRAAVVLDVLA